MCALKYFKFYLEFSEALDKPASALNFGSGFALCADFLETSNQGKNVADTLFLW